MSAETESHTRLHGGWLLVARLAWGVVFLTLIVMYALGFLAVREVLSTVCAEEPCTLRQQIRHTEAGERVMDWGGPPEGYADPLRPDQVKVLEPLGLTLDQYGWLGALQLGIPALVYLLIAAGLFWWKSDDGMVLFISTMVATLPFVDMPLPYTLVVHQPVWQWVFLPADFLAISSFFIFPLIFPTRRFVPRWTRWKACFDIAFAIYDTLSRNYIFKLPPDWDNATFLYIILSFVTNAYALSYRYFRVASPVERQQIKWVVVGVVGFISIALPVDRFLYYHPIIMDSARALLVSAIPDTTYRAITLFIPVSIAISVMRYRLWDIDILINRSLVYGALVAVITGVYVLVVGSLSGMLQNQNDLAAPLIAFFIIAAFVQPLRRLLQNYANRLLRFDPARREEFQAAIQKASEPFDQPKEKDLQTHVIPEVDSSPHTRLRGRWLLAARLVWIAIAMLAMVVYAASTPVAFNLLRTPCHTEPCDSSFQNPNPAIGVTLQEQEQQALSTAWYDAIWEAALRLLYLGTALLIFWRRSDDWMAHSASIMLMTLLAVASPSPLILAETQPFWRLPLALLQAIALVSTVSLFYLFPDGRFVPRWTRGLAIALWIVIGVLAAAGVPFLTEFPIFVIALAIGAVAQIYRYRRVSDPLQRQQTKWVVLGLAGMALPLLVFLVVVFFNPSLNPILATEPISPQNDAIFGAMLLVCLLIPFCFLPVTLAFSMLRYRLWDVDLVINRTVVYGALTASVVALYVLIVGWSSIGLQTQNNLAGSIFAILVIAFLFQPLRGRLQRIADRFVPVPLSASRAQPHKHQIATPESEGMADTTLRGRWLLIARLAWVSVILTLIIMYALGFAEVREALSTACEEELCTLGLQIRYTGVGEQVKNFQGAPLGSADRLRPDQVKALEPLGLTLDQYGWLGALQMGIPALAFLLIAIGLFWRKSDNWMALFVSVMVATTPLWAMPLTFTLAVRQATWEPVVGLAYFVSQSSNLTIPLIFPTGRFVPRWTRSVLLVALVHAAFWSYYRPLMEHPRADEFITVTILILSCVSLYALFYRYFRVASSLERQQLKWILVGNAGFLFTAILVLLPLNELLTSQAGSMDPARALILSAVIDTLYHATTFFFPVGIVIAVLRYRLWDVDILINRTLVYGALTGIIVVAFVVMVGLLSILFQSSGNSIIAIVATGLVALLFNPLRQRLQRNVNHLMYGERDDPYVALSRLGRQLETTLAPESVLPTVVTTVRDVLRLPYVAIYLQQDSHGYKIVAESASPSLRIENGKIRVPGMEREGVCMPLLHQGETVGYIVLGPRAPHEAFTSTDLRLLKDIAPQVGVAVHAVRLTADLQRSRERLVVAREEERRRLRRDLHDGLGPQLAGLALKLETLRNRLNGDPLADSLLADLTKRTQDATADIRHLVYDLRPPTLDELGLISALREGASLYSQQGHNGVHITIDAPESLPPLPAAVEVAVYRITQEALTNVIRHAEARACVVRLKLEESAGLLWLEVQDDGKGIHMKRQAGVGLNSMRERAEELGGTLTVTSLSTGGTLLTAHIPCRADDRNTSGTSQKES